MKKGPSHATARALWVLRLLSLGAIHLPPLSHALKADS